MYETKPVGYMEQDSFLNAVIQTCTELSPTEVRKKTSQIEDALGRQRDIRWGPRTIDIDILAYGELVLKSDVLTLPHPRMHERAFVLQPMMDVEPNWIHPLLHKSVIELLEMIQPDDKAGVQRCMTEWEKKFEHIVN